MINMCPRNPTEADFIDPQQEELRKEEQKLADDERRRLREMKAGKKPLVDDSGRGRVEQSVDRGSKE